MTKIQLSDHFTTRRLLRFAVPSILMMIFTSIYGVVDGFFVSNYAGETAFASVNLIFPFIMVLSALGFMVGTGGSALVGKTLGEKNPELANRLFSMLVYVTAIAGTGMAVLGFVLMPPVAALLGAEGQLLEGCVLYGRINMLGLPFVMLQCEFQSLFVTAEKPRLGLYVTVASGVMNMVGDALLVGVFHTSLAGAAVATVLSQMVGGAVPVVYFSRKNTSLLKLGGWYMNGRALLKVCTNGCSEFVSNISMSVVSMLYNSQLMRYAVLEGYTAEDGVSAYGVLMYVGMIFAAVFIGYAIGTAPVVSYHYGAENKEEVRNVLRRSLGVIACFSVAMVLCGELLARPLSQIYVGYDEKLMTLTLRGFFFYSFGFLFCGLTIYASSFFTALNNGIISAAISFLRTVVFQVACVLLLPLIWGMDGIWVSLAAAEGIAAVVAAVFLLARRGKEY